MKLRSLIILPPRAKLLPPAGSRARLPLLLTVVLAATAAAQLALPTRILLPPGGAVARIEVAPLPAAPPPVIAPPLLASRDLFAPSAKLPGAAGPSDPLSGAVIAGVMQQGRRRLGVVQQPGGGVRYVAVGGMLAGWRLAALDAGGARLTRGAGQKLRVAYGTRAASSPPANPQTSESGQ